ncbi:Dyp-type peroxidase [Spirosoma agri]|uniref:Dyp-type peroxidase n=1 Tax=Spirosoma agri TaxID=1987381 RepID=A0A6M0ILI1_9BACT|nr:Dyp-type peroxidase [Spirosoma agri]NEU68515.1 Dyp-type peroxidase [Spirosoma agri]
MPAEFLTQKGLSYDGTEFKAIADDLQGNILKSHGRNHTAHIFFKFRPGKVAEAKAFIRSFEHLVTSAAKQKVDTNDFDTNGSQHIFTTFYLSAAGYYYLGVKDSKTPTDPQFRAGMQASAQKLADQPDQWDNGYRNQGVHGMILLGFGGGVRAQLLERETLNISNQLLRNGLAEVFVEKGDSIKNDNGDDIEHFGYVDGISQPKFFREELNPDLATNWNPMAFWDLVLVDDPGGRPGKSYGSYLVFRKLEQHVRDFKKTEQKLAQSLFNSDSELAGAMIVGRFENGMPVTLSSEDTELNAHHDPGIPVSGSFVGKLNDFTYDSDAEGARCPFHAHIRKSNPRGESKRLDPTITTEAEQLHTMARRGIIYGKRDVHPNKQKNLDKLPNGGVGLLFMSFQRSLANQFEFIQSAWVNEDNFVHGFLPGDKPTGKDPVIGQGSFDVLTHQYTRTYDNANTIDKLHAPLDPANHVNDFGKFVTTRGGEYFFAPSKTFLRTL